MTRYAALLRGVNVGGSKMVGMAQLAAAFESAGMTGVRTYINSGNVVFTSGAADRTRLARALAEAIRERTGHDVDVMLRSAQQLSAIVDAIPESWRNDGSMKCDVVFFADGVDASAALQTLGPRPGIEDAFALSGALVWRVDRADATRSRLTRMVGTPLYKQATVRNCNTVRKLAAMTAD